MRPFKTLPIVLLTSLALLAGAQTGAHAEGAEPIRLTEILQVAVRQSPSLASARLDLKVAEAQVVQSLGIQDLLVQASGNVFRQSSEAVTGDIVGTNSSDNVNAEASVSKLLTTGGTLSLHGSGSRRASELAFNGQKITQYNTQVDASFVQPLLRGRGEDMTLANQAQARTSLSATQLDLQARTRDELRAIIDAYWELVYAHKDLEIRKSALDLAQERRRLTSSSIALGSAAKTALLEVDQVIATNEEEILLAQQRVTSRSLDLRRLAGLEIGRNHLDLAPEEALAAKPEAVDLDTVIDAAFRVSPELAALAEREKGASIAVKVTDNGYLPRLDLNLSAGPVGIDDNFGGSVSNLATLKGYFVGGGLSFEQRIDSQWAAGSKDEAQARLHQIKVSDRDIRAQIAVAAATAVQNAQITDKRMELSQLAMSLSEKNIEAERRRFELGKATNFDVLQRQEEQKQARLRYARAAVDHLHAMISIQSLDGSLLQKYGITMDK